MCGCDMNQKTKFKTAKCPANKWKSEVKLIDIERLKAAIDAVEGKRLVQNTEVEGIVQAYNQAFQAKRTIKRCGTCMNDLITEAKEAIRNANT